MSWHRSSVVGFGVCAIVLSTSFALARAQDSPAASGAWLGITVERLRGDVRDRSGDASNGVLVSEVAPGGPAAKAGMRPGDVLVVIGSTTVHDPRELAGIERHLEPDAPVSVVLSRDAGRMIKVVNVTPSSAEERKALAEAGNPDAPVPGMGSLHGTGRAPSGGEGEVKQQAKDSAEPSANAGDEPAKPGDEDALAPAQPAPASAPTPAGAPSAPPAAASPGEAMGGLGIEAHDLDSDLSAALGLGDVHGVMVLGVKPGGAAERAGLKPGDVITQADDAEVTNLADLQRRVGAASGSVSLHVHHQGVQRDVDVELDEPKAAATPQASDEDAPAAPQASDPDEPSVAPDAGPSSDDSQAAPAVPAPHSIAAPAPDDAHQAEVDRSLTELRDEIRILRAELTRLRAQVQELRGD